MRMPKGQSERITFGAYLALLRETTGLSLRQVEAATENEVSNAYLSQLEKDKISKPSPNVLHALARVYNASYEELMNTLRTAAWWLIPTGFLTLAFTLSVPRWKT